MSTPREPQQPRGDRPDASDGTALPTGAGWRIVRFPEHHVRAAVVLDAELFPDENWDHRTWRNETRSRDRIYLAVEAEDGTLIGTAGAAVFGEIADLDTIGTSRPGAGIGRALLAALEEAVTARGAERMLLEVRGDNERAMALYRKNGYRAISVRKRYYPTPTGPIDALVMEKVLVAGVEPTPPAGDDC